jgi:peptidoglycan DL-endopeptidase CwlO
MRTIVLLAGLVWITGCATGKAGAPLGGQALFESYRYRPATPAAMPRAIPEADEEPTQSKPVLAEAPKREAPAAKSPPRVKRPEPKKRVQTVSRPVVSRDARETVLATARTLVGKSQLKVGGRAYPNDCTGLVEAAYSHAGLPLKGSAKPGDNGVTAIYRYALNHGRVYNGGRPVPGDLVFFRETYDQNRDGRRNDGLTHVGIDPSREARRGALPDEPRQASRREGPAQRQDPQRHAARPGLHEGLRADRAALRRLRQRAPLPQARCRGAALASQGPSHGSLLPRSHSLSA